MTTVKKQPIVYNSYLSSDFSFNTDAQLGCNLNNTQILTSIPSSTSESEGTYIFKKSTGKSFIVNCSGTKLDSSIDFVSVSSVETPKTMANISNNGLRIGDVVVESGEVKIDGLSVKSTIDVHTEQIASLTSFDIREVVKNSQLDAVDIALGGRITVNESDIVLLKANDVEHDSKISLLENADTLLIGRTTVLETDVTKAKQDILNLAAVDVTELAKISDLEAKDVVYAARFVVDETKIDVLEKKQPLIYSQPVHYVRGVYADSQQMIDYIPESISNITPYSGWYFKNEENKKVNWYLSGFVGMKVKDISALMLNFYNVSASNGTGCPFFIVYTNTDSITPNAESWYKSRKVYPLNHASSVNSSTAYSLVADLKQITYDPIAWNHIKIYADEIAETDRGEFDDEETVKFFSISTGSNSAAGLFDFIASKFTIFTKDTSYEYVFIQK